MNCPNCGIGNAAEAFVCSSCGTALVSATPSSDPTPSADPPAPTAPTPEPYAPPPGSAEYPAPGAPQPGYPTTQGYPSGDPGYPPPGAQQPPPGSYPPPGSQPPPQPGQFPPGAPGAPGPYPPPGAPQYPPGPGQPGGPGYGPPSGGGFPPYPPAGPGGPGGPKKDNRGTIFALLGVLLVVAIGAAAFIVTRDDETGTSVGASILLEPVSSVGNDPFSDSFDDEDFAEPLDIALAGFPDLGKETASALAGRASSGTDPGLYGGSQNQAVCKVDELVAFLTDPANAEKAEAWAATLDVEAGDIETYVRSLTPVRLRFDTRVTNHGYRDGAATPIQSVLQAGTGVLVDGKGVPRVKCNCGNPLLEPAPLAEVPSDEEERTLEIAFVASNPDAAWEGLDANNVVSVEAGDETETFTLVDLETGRFFRRPIGTNGEEDTFVEIGGEEELCVAMPDSPSCEVEQLGSGDVTLTLQWGSQADLDLHVIEPDGTEISWESTSSPSGGALDLDSNAQCAAGPAVEHIVWPEGSAPEGSYTVSVYGYAFTATDGTDCGSGDYHLTINVGGEETEYDGTVGLDESQEYDFEA